VVDGAEELSELDTAMASVVLGNDLPALDVQRSEERGGPVAHVVVGPALDLPWPHGQNGLAAIERLNLRLLVNAKHERTVRGIQVKPDDISNLLNQQRIRWRA
jgi:hypothetical protein